MKSIEEFLFWRLKVKLLRLVLAFCGATAMLIIVLCVFMRYILKSDLYGFEEIITVVAMWLYFGGGAYASYSGVHITAEVFSEYIKSPLVRKCLKICVCSLSLLCSVVLAKWGIDFISWRIQVGGSSTSLKIPLILSQIPICICFLLMVLYNVYHLANSIIGRSPRIVNKGGVLE